MAQKELGTVVTELRRNATHLQWRPRDTGVWEDLVPLADLLGRNIELREGDRCIEWRIVNTQDPWKLLFDFGGIRGDTGDRGIPGADAMLHMVTYETRIVYESSSVRVTATGPDTAKHMHFEFNLEDVSHAIHRHNIDPEAHAPLKEYVHKAIAESGATLEWTGGILYLRKPNGEVAGFVNIAASSVDITGVWTVPTPVL